MSVTRRSWLKSVAGALAAAVALPAALTPAATQFVPLPGADKLNPRDLIDQATEKLLQEAGVPAELYSGATKLTSVKLPYSPYDAWIRAMIEEEDRRFLAEIRRLAEPLNVIGATKSLAQVPFA